MATDERKRQKKLAKRAAKLKAKHKEIRAKNPESMIGRLLPYAQAPVLHCYYTEDVWTNGIGNVLISRVRGNEVAFADFLLDVFCLGVKDVNLGIAPRALYEEKLNEALRRRYTVIDASPACIRKLVEGGVAFARQLGLPPHSDYRKAAALFGDIDPAECDIEFTYGHNGKPLFIPGPNDDAPKIARVMHAIGSQGGHFLMPVAERQALELLGDAEFEEEDEDYDRPPLLNAPDHRRFDEGDQT